MRDAPKYSCDVCLGLHPNSQLVPYHEGQVPLHIIDNRGGYYYICHYCIGDNLALEERDGN